MSYLQSITTQTPNWSILEDYQTQPQTTEEDTSRTFFGEKKLEVLPTPLTYKDTPSQKDHCHLPVGEQLSEEHILKEERVQKRKRSTTARRMEIGKNTENAKLTPVNEPTWTNYASVPPLKDYEEFLNDLNFPKYGVQRCFSHTMKKEEIGNAMSPGYGVQQGQENPGKQETIYRNPSQSPIFTLKKVDPNGGMGMTDIKLLSSMTSEILGGVLPKCCPSSIDMKSELSIKEDTVSLNVRIYMSPPRKVQRKCTKTPENVSTNYSAE